MEEQKRRKKKPNGEEWQENKEPVEKNDWDSPVKKEKRKKRHRVVNQEKDKEATPDESQTLQEMYGYDRNARSPKRSRANQTTEEDGNNII